jgi:dTDP-4-dehydrorhamnose reductase
MTNEVEIVINNAASVDFDLRVDLNMKINAIGAMNILKFSKACKNIKVCCHVSTAYVASNQP